MHQKTNRKTYRSKHRPPPASIATKVCTNTLQCRIKSRRPCEIEELNLKTLVRNYDLIAVEMYGDVVMLIIENGQYHGLTGIAPRIWECLETPHTIDELLVDLFHRTLQRKCWCRMLTFFDRHA